VKAGDIWRAQLDPTVGSEIQKTTPLRGGVSGGNECSPAHRHRGADDHRLAAGGLQGGGHLPGQTGFDRAGPGPHAGPRSTGPLPSACWPGGCMYCASRKSLTVQQTRVRSYLLSLLTRIARRPSGRLLLGAFGHAHSLRDESHRPPPEPQTRPGVQDHGRGCAEKSLRRVVAHLPRAQFAVPGARARSLP
jgi:hypothetical protein